MFHLLAMKLIFTHCRCQQCSTGKFASTEGKEDCDPCPRGTSSQSGWMPGTHMWLTPCRQEALRAIHAFPGDTSTKPARPTVCSVMLVSSRMYQNSEGAAADVTLRVHTVPAASLVKPARSKMRWGRRNARAVHLESFPTQALQLPASPAALEASLKDR